MKMPQTIGLVHFIGIGGIGMSGIAEVLKNLGYRVQGSDQADGANIQRLRENGIECFVGHSAENLGAAEVVVVSTAIKKSNPELKAAREKLLPIVRRAEMLAELMRFRQAVAIGGTHGKTTTTSMVATLLDAGGLDPTVVNGGIINAYGTNARMGEGEWMVVEADESDGTFLKLPADIAVVTNIDPEHLDHYGTFDNVREAFRQFVENVPFYGFGVMCTDHPEVQAMVARIEDRRIITYGANAQADVRFSNHRMNGASSQFDVSIRNRKTGVDTLIADLTLPMPGRHNVSNATAAIAVAHELGISADDIKKGLSAFGGVKRRFTRTGSWNGVDIFDDYGHHPGRDQGGAEGCARRHFGPRHRDRAAASLHAPARSVRRVLLLLQRRRHGRHGAGLCGRRGPDRRRQFGKARPPHPLRRPSRRALCRRAVGDRAADPRDWRSPATSSSSSAPATSPNGPMRCPRNSRPATRRPHDQRAKRFSPASATGLQAFAAASRRMRRWTRSPGSAPAVSPRRSTSRPTRTTSRPSSRPSREDVPLTIVGIGSNLLVREGGIPGFVIRLSAKGFGDAEVVSPTRIRAGAATPDKRVAALALRGRHRRLPFLPRHSRRASAARCA